MGVTGKDKILEWDIEEGLCLFFLIWTHYTYQHPGPHFHPCLPVVSVAWRDGPLAGSRAMSEGF